MSVNGHVLQVVQISPPPNMGNLWSGDNSTGFVSGGGGFKPRYIIVSSFSKIFCYSHNFDGSHNELIINIRYTCLMLNLMRCLYMPIWFEADNPSHATVSFVADTSGGIMLDTNAARPN